MADSKSQNVGAEELAIGESGLAFAADDAIDLDTLFEALGIAEAEAEHLDSLASGQSGTQDAGSGTADADSPLPVDFTIVLDDIAGTVDTDDSGTV